MSKEKQTIAFIDALRAYNKQLDKVVEFERILIKWDKQRTITWGGVTLEITHQVAQAFRRDLNHDLEHLRQTLNNARNELEK